MDVENDEQAEQCRNKESDSEEHDRLGHRATLVTLLEPRSGSTSSQSDLEPVLSGRATDGAAVVLPVRPSPFNSPLCLATLTPSDNSGPDQLVLHAIPSQGAQQVSKMSVATAAAENALVTWVVDCSKCRSIDCPGHLPSARRQFTPTALA